MLEEGAERTADEYIVPGCTQREKRNGRSLFAETRMSQEDVTLETVWAGGMIMCARCTSQHLRWALPSVTCACQEEAQAVGAREACACQEEAQAGPSPQRAPGGRLPSVRRLFRHSAHQRSQGVWAAHGGCEGRSGESRAQMRLAASQGNVSWKGI